VTDANPFLSSAASLVTDLARIRPWVDLQGDLFCFFCDTRFGDAHEDWCIWAAAGRLVEAATQVMDR
jgi:hypothetical protein